MPLEWAKDNLPLAAVALGLLLLAWSQRSRLMGLLRRPSQSELSPAERFAMLIALRRWCQKAGHTEAVKALDGQVLPAIVQGDSPK